MGLRSGFWHKGGVGLIKNASGASASGYEAMRDTPSIVKSTPFTYTGLTSVRGHVASIECFLWHLKGTPGAGTQESLCCGRCMYGCRPPFRVIE